MLVALRFIFFCLIAPPILLAALIYIATDNKPDINIRWSLTKQDIKRAKNLLDRQTSNRTQTTKSLKLTEKDLNIVANYILNQHIQSASQISLFENKLAFKTSITMPNNLLNPYLNIRFHLVQQNNNPTIDSLSFGQITIPDEFSGWLLNQVIQYSQLNQFAVQVSQNISDIKITPQSLELLYNRSNASDKTSQLLPTIPDNDAILFYQQRLAEIIRNHDRNWLLSLADLLQPMFKDAYRRSTELNAIKENQAIIFVVSAYVNRQKIQAIVPDLIISPAAEQLPVYIYQRIDLAQHFMASAALTAFGNAQLSHLVGQEKELHDANQGSGFSFVDLAADRAGIRFGESATLSALNARQLQKKMGQIKDYKAFIPDIRDLPESMPTAQFQSRFESVHSKAYQDLLKNIDRRISACTIYTNS